MWGLRVSETLMESDDTVYFYESVKPGINFEKYYVSSSLGESVKMPVVRIGNQSLFNPSEPSNIILKITDHVNPSPPDVEMFFKGVFSDVSRTLVLGNIPNVPVIAVRSIRNGGKIKIEAGRTFLHDVFLSHHLADFEVAGRTLRSVFAGEVSRFVKKLENPLLPTPLKLSIVFLSRDGYVILNSKGDLFNPSKGLTPFNFYPSFPFGKDIVSLGDLVRNCVPEELLKGSITRVFSFHVDVRTMGEVVIGIVVVSKKTAIEIKKHLNTDWKPLPLNVVRLPKFKDFPSRRVTVSRVIAESIESFTNTLKVSYEVFTLLNE